MFEIFIQNLYLIAPTMWGIFIAYGAWYFTRAKKSSPLTTTEAKTLWTIHKQNSRCHSKRWRQVKHGNQTIGFQCDCGYKHLQKRPLVAHSPAALSTAQINAFDQLHTSHKSS